MILTVNRENGSLRSKRTNIKIAPDAFKMKKNEP